MSRLLGNKGNERLSNEMYDFRIKSTIFEMFQTTSILKMSQIDVF